MKKFKFLSIIFLSYFSISFAYVFNVSTAVEFQNALDAAKTNGEDDTIYLSEGIFLTKSLNNGKGFVYDDAGGTLNIDNNSLTIIGKGKGKTIISGKNVKGSSVLYISSYNKPNFHITIKNLTISDGDTTFINSGNSQSSSGGGLFASTAGNITIENVEFKYNSAGLNGNGGGAHLVSTSGVIKVDKCIFYKNTASVGGGLSINTGIIGTSSNSSAIITNNIFYKNSSYNGMGLTVSDYSSGNINIINNTFVENINLTSAPQNNSFGGGIHIIPSTQSTNINIYNNIFWGNQTASNLAKDIYISNANLPQLNATFNIHNNITEISKNATYVAAYNPNTINAKYGNNFRQDPLFKDKANLDFFLQPNSPCIDKGNSNIPINITSDYYGNKRIVDGDKDGTATIDIGALEYTDNPVNTGNSAGSNNTLGSSGGSGNNSTSSSGGGGCHFGSGNSLLSLLIIGLFIFLKNLWRGRKWGTLQN